MAWENPSDVVRHQHFARGTKALSAGLAILVITLVVSRTGSARGEDEAVGNLEPRAEFSHPDITNYPTGYRAQAIIVKFTEQSGVRFANRTPFSEKRQSVTSLARVTSEIAAMVSPVYERPRQDLQNDKRRGEAATGRELADLTLFYRIDLIAPEDALPALIALLDLPTVETAYFPPVPVKSPTDLAPATSDYTANQTYHATAPSGVDSAYARTLPGGRGTGVRVCDIEYNWFSAHEEFNDVGITLLGNTPQVPANLNSLAETNHGTASLAVVGADDNGYGVRGIASQAQLFIAGSNTQQGGYNPAAAINLAATTLSAGDVLLLEMQGCADPNCNVLVPIEWYAAEYAAISTAVANGVIVVEAAGNGGNDLSDTNQFGQVFRRSVQDSGAIMVAAADSSGNPLSYTNHCTTDSRIDVFCWGNSDVVSAGYGDLFFPSSDSLQAYTSQFSGTSSASAIVAGCAASLQGIAQQMLGKTLTPATIRRHLVSTGTAQAASSSLIGTQPDLRGAVSELMNESIALAPSQIVPGTPSLNPLQPFEVIAPDLNGDGFPDLVFSALDGFTLNGHLEIALNSGGAFGPTTGPIGLGFGQPFLTTGDFNGDGNPDIAATASTLITVLLGDGFGGFLNIIQTGLPSAGGALDHGDFDGDGNEDLCVLLGGAIAVLLGNGGSGFTFTSFAYPASSWGDVVVSDVNGDGSPDWVVTGTDTTILLNDGTGSPQPNPYQASVAGGSIGVGDLNQDGAPDIVVLTGSGPTLTTLLGDGAGLATVASTSTFSSGLAGTEMILDDFNGDLLLDVAIAGVTTANPPAGPGILLGDGRGGFGPAAGSQSQAFGFAGLASGDFQGLGAPGLALVIGNPAVGIDVELFINPVSPQRMRARAGNVDETRGVARDVLTVNGQTGDVDRILRIAANTPFTIAIAAPPNSPSPAPYVLYAVRSKVGFSNEAVQPSNLGTTCFPTVLSGGTLPGTIVLANSLGFNGLLGTPLLNRPAAPATIATANSGLAAGSRIFLQGFIRDNNGFAPVTITNGIELQIW